MPKKFRLVPIGDTIYPAVSVNRPGSCPMPVKLAITFEYKRSAEQIKQLIQERRNLCFVECDLDCPDKQHILDALDEISD